MQVKTKGAMKISTSRASKWAPIWHSLLTTPKSLSCQPNPGPIQAQSRPVPEAVHRGILRQSVSYVMWGLVSWCAYFHCALSIDLHFFMSLDCPMQFQCIRDFAFIVLYNWSSYIFLKLPPTLYVEGFFLASFRLSCIFCNYNFCYWSNVSSDCK